MRPYYQDDSVTIYHGDCRELLSLVPVQSLVLTDPPYGIKLNTAYKTAKRGFFASANDYEPVFGDDAEFDPTHLLGFQSLVL